MRSLAFTKMEGAGNDYVYVDAIHDAFDFERGGELAQFVADRHFGVGGDGLIALAPSADAGADVAMVMWNADGSRGPMCGNGIRCLAKLAHDVGVVRGPTVHVATDSGTKAVELVFTAGVVTGARVDMGAVQVASEPVGVTVAGREWQYYGVDAGNAHAVLFLPGDPDAAPVHEVGAWLQRHDAFPAGVNVEFVQVQPDGALKQRTFERGSGETLACGSGATAAACAAVRLGRVPGPGVVVRLRGGELIIRCDGERVVMEGPARTVFRGVIEVPER